MKKIKNILLVLGVFIISVSSAQKIQKEHFTTIDKLFYVEIGMTTNEVQTTLGVEPFDFYQNLSEFCSQTLSEFICHSSTAR